MKHTLIVLMTMAVLGCATEARAERASVAVAKATVVAAKAASRAAVATAKAVPKACPWRGLKWLAKHV